VERWKAKPGTNYHARGALWEKWLLRITTTHEWNFEKRTHERTTTTRWVHFEKSGNYGSLTLTSVSLQSEPMNEHLSHARCTLKKVTSCMDHYHARVEIWKAKPKSNESNQT